MKIESAFMTGILSKIVNTVIRKKTERDVLIRLNKIHAVVRDGKTILHVDADIEIEKEELLKLLQNVG